MADSAELERQPRGKNIEAGMDDEVQCSEAVSYLVDNFSREIKRMVLWLDLGQDPGDSVDLTISRGLTKIRESATVSSLRNGKTDPSETIPLWMKGKVTRALMNLGLGNGIKDLISLKLARGDKGGSVVLEREILQAIVLEMAIQRSPRR